MITYNISPSQAHNHLFSVSIIFPSEVGKTYELSLPAWLPGSYMIRDFAKNIIEINAINAKQDPLTLNKVDKQTWSITATDQQISISYQVYAFDLSVRTAYLDNQRGFFNGSSTFLAIKELVELPCQLFIELPEVEQGLKSSLTPFKNWRVATGLTRGKGTKKYAFGEYIANNYAELIDCPVAIGDFDVSKFIVEGITHHMVFTSKHYGDKERLICDITKLCQHHINLFSEAPFKEYWFITHLLANGFGGLEHKNSTILQASRFDLPNPNQPEELSDNYQTFLSLCSHEYFHAWNVCRIKPKEFHPYNLQNEVYTKQLWAYEGITSYYDDFSLYRAGIIEFDAYLALLSKTATRVYRGQGELKQSVTDSSYYTWTKFYQQGPDAVNNIVSYYTKGSLIALWLDLTIREKSQGKYSLDNLMKELWIHFGRPNMGTQEEDFVNIANILCGEDISQDFQNLLYKAERVNLAPLLECVGVSFTPTKFEKLNKLSTTNHKGYVPYIGAQYKTDPKGLIITNIIDNSPAAQAGLAVNDIIIAVDNMMVTEQSIQNIADHLSENTTVNCHYCRDDQLIMAPLTFIDAPLSGICIEVKNSDLTARWQKIIH